MSVVIAKMIGAGVIFKTFASLPRHRSRSAPRGGLCETLISAIRRSTVLTWNADCLATVNIGGYKHDARQHVTRRRQPSRQYGRGNQALFGLPLDLRTHHAALHREGWDARSRQPHRRDEGLHSALHHLRGFHGSRVIDALSSLYTLR